MIRRSQTDNLLDDDDQDATMIEPDIFNFTGRDFDPEVGLQYHQARHYDPTVGRWINEDPIGYEDGANLYRYVANKPEWQNPRRPIRPTSCILTR